MIYLFVYITKSSSQIHCKRVVQYRTPSSEWVSEWMSVNQWNVTHKCSPSPPATEINTKTLTAWPTSTLTCCCDRDSEWEGGCCWAGERQPRRRFNIIIMFSLTNRYLTLKKTKFWHRRSTINLPWYIRTCCWRYENNNDIYKLISYIRSIT